MVFYSNDKTIKFTEAMEEHILDKIQKLNKYVTDLDGKVTLKKEGILLKLEITLPGNIRASRAGEDFYLLVNDVIDQLESQIKKSFKVSKEKKHNNLIKEAFDINDYEELPYKVREKIIFKERMTQDEAIEEMELLGHQFFIYEDFEDNNISVIYKRNDGNYGRLVLR